MLYNYKATTPSGEEQSGSIDAASIDLAISALQRRSLIIVNINPAGEGTGLAKRITLFEHVPLKNVVILSRQISTLFEANVPVLNAFRLLAQESDNDFFRKVLEEVADDIQGGVRISIAMAKHPKVFSLFYVNMVKAAEESGKLSETFLYLADYMERSYELVRKARNALIYPIFVVLVFITVMILMLVIVIPQLSGVLLESGQQLPIYTKIIVGTSQFLRSYGLVVLAFLVVGGLFTWRYARTKIGKLSMDRFKLSVPYIGDLYKRLYLSRISDNIDTMLESGIPMVKAIEVTADVVGSEVYRQSLLENAEAIKGGSSVADAFASSGEIPQIMVQMTRIGEETGKLGYMLKTISRFYKREVDSAVETLVGLIEPAMIVVLGLMVGVMLAAVLVPIYNITSSI